MASNINPNNIDGSYPVAGQDNSSQGFRDNFTNIKQNFQYAEDEINDLQNKSILKAALIGQTLDNNMNDNLLYAARIQDFGATKVSVTGTSGTLTLNYASGHYQTISTTGSVTLTFTNFPSSGVYGYYKLQINITNVAHTLTLPAAVSLGLDGIQGISPGTAGVSNTITFGATGYYEFGFGTYDGGSTITLFDLNRGLTDFTAADISLDDLTLTGNITANSASKTASFTTVTASATVSATGNITGGNILTGGTVSSTGNVQGGNIRTVGLMSATGNVSGGNVVGYIRPAAGGTAASTAALQFVSGSLLTTAAAGAFEYDGTVLYGTQTASQRGVLSPTIFMALSADYVGSDVNTAQKVFDATTNGAVTVDAATTYLFEAVYYITRAAGTTNHTTGVLFGGTATLTSISYRAEATSTTGNVLGTPSVIYGTAATVLVVTAASTSATENITIKLNGIIRTNAAGTLIPQFQYSAAPGGAPTVVKNSYICLRSIGTSSVTNVGNWS